MSSTLRHLKTADYQLVLRVADEWWGGRSITSILLRVFFEHFQSTSFVLEEQGTLQGFLIGFRSQTAPTQAYIHAVGTNPQKRGQGYGRRLYQHFFEVMSNAGCTEVLCITSPINKGSIAFHTRMGFEILPGDAQVDGVAVTSNYDGRGNGRVLFRRMLVKR